jgi:hypothetical protein
MVVLAGWAKRLSGEQSAQQGWNGRILNQYEAKIILAGAWGVLSVHYRHSRRKWLFSTLSGRYDEAHCQESPS